MPRACAPLRSYVKDTASGQGWFEFNDEKVTRLSESDDDVGFLEKVFGGAFNSPADAAVVTCCTISS